MVCDEPKCVGIRFLTLLSFRHQLTRPESFPYTAVTPAELDSFFVAYSHFKLTPQQLIAKLSDLYKKPPATVIGTNIPITPQEAKQRVTTFFSKWLANPLQTDFVAGTDGGILDSYVRFVEALRQDGVDIDSVRTTNLWLIPTTKMTTSNDGFFVAAHYSP